LLFIFLSFSPYRSANRRTSSHVTYLVIFVVAHEEQLSYQIVAGNFFFFRKISVYRQQMPRSSDNICATAKKEEVTK